MRQKSLDELTIQCTNREAMRLELGRNSGKAVLCLASGHNISPDVCMYVGIDILQYPYVIMCTLLAAMCEYCCTSVRT